MKADLDLLPDIFPSLSHGRFIPYSPLLVIFKGRSNCPIDRIIEEIEFISREERRCNIYGSIDKMHRALTTHYPDVYVPSDLLTNLLLEDFSLVSETDLTNSNFPFIDPDSVESLASESPAATEPPVSKHKGIDSPVVLDKEKFTFKEKMCQNLVIKRSFKNASEFFLFKTSGPLNNQLVMLPLVDQSSSIDKTSKNLVFSEPDPSFISNASHLIDPWLIPRFGFIQTKKPLLIYSQKMTIKQLAFSPQFGILGVRTGSNVCLFDVPDTLLSWNSPIHWNTARKLSLSVFNDFLERTLSVFLILKMRLSPFKKYDLALLLSSPSLVTWKERSLSIHVIDLAHLVSGSRAEVDFEYSSKDEDTFVFASNNSIFLLNSAECHVVFDLALMSTTRALGSFCLLDQHPEIPHLYFAADSTQLFLFDMRDYEKGPILPRLCWKYQLSIAGQRALGRLEFFSYPPTSDSVLHGVLAWNKDERDVLLFVFQIQDVRSGILYQSASRFPFLLCSVNNFRGFRNDYLRDTSLLPLDMISPRRNSNLVDVIPLVSYDLNLGCYLLNILQAYSDEEIYICSYRWQSSPGSKERVFGVCLDAWHAYLERYFQQDEIFLPFTYDKAGRLFKVGVSPSWYRASSKRIDMTSFFKFMLDRILFSKRLAASDLSRVVLGENDRIISTFLSSSETFSLSFEAIRRLLVNRVAKMAAHRVSFATLIDHMDSILMEIMKAWRKAAKANGLVLSGGSPEFTRFLGERRISGLDSCKAAFDNEKASFAAVRDKLTKQLGQSEDKFRAVLENGSIRQLSLPTLVYISDSLSFSSLLIEKPPGTRPESVCNLIMDLGAKWDLFKSQIQDVLESPPLAISQSQAQSSQVSLSSILPKIRTETQQPLSQTSNSASSRKKARKSGF